MSDKPLPPELRQLIEAERSRPDAPADAKASAQAQLSALLGPVAGLGRPDGAAPNAGVGGSGAPSGVSASASAVPLAKLLAVLALGGLAGGGVATALIRPAERIVYVERPAAVASPLATPVGPLPTSSEAASKLAVPAASASASSVALPPTSGASSTPRSRDTDLAAERAVIERARSALARGDGQAALSAVTQHQHEFPRGQLSEEREVLAVQALATAGRAAEAAERGAHFRKSFPNSLLLPLVDQALR